MSSTIVNATGKTTIFGTNGSAITSQPVNTTSTAVGGIFEGGLVSTKDSNNNSSSATDSGADFPNKVGITTNVGGAGDGSPGTKLTYVSDHGSGVKVNDLLLTNKGFVTRVLAFTADTITTDIPYSTRTDFLTLSGTYLYKLPLDIIGQNSPGVYSAVGLAKTHLGSADNSILGGALGPFNSVNKNAAVYTTKTNAAFAAGYWSDLTGKFSTAPSTTNDYNTTGAFKPDASIGSKRTVYNVGGTTVATVG